MTPTPLLIGGKRGPKAAPIIPSEPPNLAPILRVCYFPSRTTASSDLPVKTSELWKPANHQEAELLEKLDSKRLPHHVAIIMDGNGRWAERRHLPRVAGHQRGVKAAREIIEACARLKLPCLTLYAFSRENWTRPQAEVEFLMRLLREYLKRELPAIKKNKIGLRIMGRESGLPAAVLQNLEQRREQTGTNTAMNL